MSNTVNRITRGITHHAQRYRAWLELARETGHGCLLADFHREHCRLIASEAKSNSNAKVIFYMAREDMKSYRVTTS